MANKQMSAMDVSSRMKRLRTSLDQLGCDALLLTNLTNIRYLTGFSGSAALLAISADGALLTTDGRYEIQSAQQTGASGVDVDLVIGGLKKQKDALIAFASSTNKLGLEATNVTWSQQRSFANDWFASSELVPTRDAVESLRLIKDEGEVERIGEACRIADDALTNMKPMLLDGPTEAEFALALDFEMRRLGADDVSFDTIVASGPNGAKAHHEPSDRAIDKGELVVVDDGAIVDGYHSDTTRTLCVGEPATDELQRMYDVVYKSQSLGVQKIGEGVPVSDVDKECRQLIETEGWGDKFTHSTGHGVGLDIHEAPAVAAAVTSTEAHRSVGNADLLTRNQVITVEPGVYLAGIGGVRIEDTVVVTRDGCEILSKVSKDLVVSG